MNCSDIEKALADYLGGELPEETRRAFETHLAACPACRAGVTGLAQTQEQIRGLDTVTLEAAADLTRDLYVVRRRPAAARMTWSLLKAAAVLALGVGLGRLTSVTSAGDVPSAVSPTEQTATVAVVATDPAVGPVHPHWIELGRRTSRSSLAAQLAPFAGAIPR